MPIDPGMMPSSPASRPDRALAGHDDVLAEVALPGDVVVVAVHGRLGLEVPDHVAQVSRTSSTMMSRFVRRVILAPPKVPHVIVELSGARREVREIRIGERDGELLHHALGLRDVALRHDLADVAGPGVQEDPHAGIVLVDADLDEVVAASQCAALMRRLPPLGFVGHRRQIRLHGRREQRRSPWVGILALVEAHGDPALDRGAQLAAAPGSFEGGGATMS